MVENFINDLKIIVLDDDPTGTQTVNSIYVYTDWTYENILKGFQSKEKLFYILTNSRSFTKELTERIHREIADRILQASIATGQDFLIISRGDSTLRGHFPIETDTLKDEIEKNSNIQFDGEIIIPFFKEGNRITKDNIHYIQYDDKLIPVGDSEFAKDKTFSYSNSHLGKWIEEKTNGKFKENEVIYITLEELRNGKDNEIQDKLLHATNFNKVIVNATEYSDVEVFADNFIVALRKGKKYIVQSASSFVKVIGEIESKPLIDSSYFQSDNENGGLIVVGSHVKKTSDQLQLLLDEKFVFSIEFNQHLVLDKNKFKDEISRVIRLANEKIKTGITCVVYTKRERLDLNTKNKEDELAIAVEISNGITEIVRHLEVRPRYIIAKGGITSSDVATKGLNIMKAYVLGQIKPGIPVWLADKESKFPDIPYIIFPGNVGETNLLLDVVKTVDNC